jgi:hypothetical protein
MRGLNKVLRVVMLVSTFLPLTMLAQPFEDNLNKARTALKEKRYSEAQQYGSNAIQIDRSRWEGWFVTATALVGLQRPEPAHEYFAQAFQRAPESAKADIKKAIEASQTMIQAAGPGQPRQTGPPRELMSPTSPAITIIEQTGYKWNFSRELDDGRVLIFRDRTRDTSGGPEMGMLSPQGQWLWSVRDIQFRGGNAFPLSQPTRVIAKTVDGWTLTYDLRGNLIGRERSPN